DIVKIELPKKGASMRTAAISMTRTAMPTSATDSRSQKLRLRALMRGVSGAACAKSIARNPSGRHEMKLHSVGISLIASELLRAAAVAEAADPPVGRASRITGERVSSAQAPGGPVRKLAEGDAISAGERIRTGAGTVLQIDFTDKSRMTLGPNTEFEVEQY